MITKQDFYSQLKTKAFAGVPLNITQEEIREAVASFMVFLEATDEVKNHIDFKISKKHRRGDVGYKKRLAEDHMYNDNKEFFHYHPAIMNHYPYFVQNEPAVKNFISHAHPLWEKVITVIKPLLSYFEEDYTGLLDKIFDKEDPHILLRFLKYEWEASGEYLAKPHFDAGSFTLAIAEDTPGLRIGTGPDDLTLVAHQTGQGLFFVSSNYAKLIKEGDFKPAWHDVIQLDETKIGKPYSRWAVVAFIEADVEALPRSETHKFYEGEAA